MDPLTAFSLAAGIIQVVDVSFKVLAQCKELYKKGSLVEHRETAAVVDALAKATTALNTSMADQPNSSLSNDDKDILGLSDKCSKTAQGLLAELEKLKLEQGGRRQAFMKSIRAMRHKQSLKEKQNDLEKFWGALDTQILVRLNTQCLRATQQFETLDKSVRDLAQGLDNGFNTVAKLLEAQSRQLIDHMDHRFDDYEQKTTDRQAELQFINSLYFPEILAREEQIPDAFKGTCEWIFEPTDSLGQQKPWDNFRDWLEDGSDVYWINGKPGAGKSTLMKYIVDEDRTKQCLNSWKGQNELLVTSFFFWSTGSELQKSSTGLLRSLIRQIAIRWPALIDLVRDVHTGPGEPHETSRNLDLLAAWTDRRLLSTLHRLLDQRPASAFICVFMDGLDEFAGDIDLLLEIVRLFVQTSGVKICVSSRPDQAFREEFHACPQLKVHDLNQRDMEAIVKKKLVPVISQWVTAKQGQVQEFEQLLVRKAQGVWLWLDLMIKDLIEGARNRDNIKELYLRIDRTPDSIKGLYIQKIRGLDTLYLEEAVRYFQILIVRNDRNTPVSLLGLAVAEGEWWDRIATHEYSYFETPAFDEYCQRFEVRLLSRCAGLVEVERMNGEPGSIAERHFRPVSFIHRTVIEFLQAQLGSSFLDPSWFSRACWVLAHAYIGVSALHLLHPEYYDRYFKSSDSMEGFRERFPLENIIEDTMSTIAQVGYSPTSTRFEHRSESMQVDLVDQFLVALQRFYAACGTGRTFFDDFDFLQRIVPRFNIFPDTRPMRDPVTFSAYFGCGGFTKFRHSITTSPNNYILDTALAGLRHCLAVATRREFPRWLGFLTVLEVVLEENIDPNRLISHLPRNGDEGTCWSAFFQALMKVSCIIIPAPATYRQEETVWTTACTKLIKRFQSLGADLNSTKKSGCFLSLRPSAVIACIAVLLEESPLSALQRLPQSVAQHFLNVQALLMSAGATHYRRFLSIKISSPDRRTRQYRLSLAQSQQLNRSMFPGPKNQDPVWLKLVARRVVAARESPSVRRFLEDFVANLSEEDRIK